MMWINAYIPIYIAASPIVIPTMSAYFVLLILFRRSAPSGPQEYLRPEFAFQQGCLDLTKPAYRVPLKSLKQSWGGKFPWNLEEGQRGFKGAYSAPSYSLCEFSTTQESLSWTPPEFAIFSFLTPRPPRSHTSWSAFIDNKIRFVRRLQVRLELLAYFLKLMQVQGWQCFHRSQHTNFTTFSPNKNIHHELVCHM